MPPAEDRPEVAGVVEDLAADVETDEASAIAVTAVETARGRKEMLRSAAEIALIAEIVVTALIAEIVATARIVETVAIVVVIVARGVERYPSVDFLTLNREFFST